MKKISLAALLLLLFLAAADCGCRKKEPAPPMVLPMVKIVHARYEPCHPAVNYVGNVTANRVYNIRARVPGFLVKRLFREGEYVERNSLLYEIEPDQYRLSCMEAVARHDAAAAKLRNAALHFKRIAELRQGDFVSPDTYDQALAARDEAAAMLAAAVAASQQSKLNLSYTRISAPFSGWIGLGAPDPGEYIASPQQKLGTLHEINPIRIEFAIPLKDLTTAEISAFQSNKPATWQVTLSRDDEIMPEKGKIRFWNNAVDESTGTFQVQAEFANRERRLLPGEFVSVSLEPESVPTRLLLPRNAVRYMQNLSYVLVADAADTLQFRPVKLAVTGTPDKVIVLGGLTPEDRVATGVNPFLRSGLKVQIAGGKP